MGESLIPACFLQFIHLFAPKNTTEKRMFQKKKYQKKYPKHLLFEELGGNSVIFQVQKRQTALESTNSPLKVDIFELPLHRN